MSAACALPDVAIEKANAEIMKQQQNNGCLFEAFSDLDVRFISKTLSYQNLCIAQVDTRQYVTRSELCTFSFRPLRAMLRTYHRATSQNSPLAVIKPFQASPLKSHALATVQEHEVFYISLLSVAPSRGSKHLSNGDDIRRERPICSVVWWTAELLLSEAAA